MIKKDTIAKVAYVVSYNVGNIIRGVVMGAASAAGGALWYRVIEPKIVTKKKPEKKAKVIGFKLN